MVYAIVLGMDAVATHSLNHVLQLGTNLDLGTSEVRNPAIYEVLVGAVGIETASLLHKDLHGNDLVPLPQFQLLSNVAIYPRIINRT